MTSFDEREKSYERKYQQEQELAFKIKARRNKLLGLWAAERLGLSPDAAEAYAAELVAAAIEQGDDGIVARVAADFARKGIAADPGRIRAELERCAREASRQLGAV